MTALRLSARRLANGLSGVTVEAISFALVALVALGAGLLALHAPSDDAALSSAITVQLAPAEAAALVAATSGAAAADAEATGEEAKLINASLPFSAAPVQAARPFALDGDEIDHKRALLCLTQAIYYEAGFEPLAGRRAVAQVVLNRMRHPAFPNSVCGVVYQGASQPVCQFSFVCDGSLYRAPAAAAWRQAQDIARAALAGNVEKSVGSATHYHADYVAPRWAPMLAKITKLGAHIFYRWPGTWGQRGAFNGRYAGEPRDPVALRPPLRSDESGAVVEQAAVKGPVADGTILKRAPNDVGGILDTSKKWTLSIPDPADIGGAASRAVAAQEGKPAAPAATIAATAAPVVASR
jgi:spore germination cell wall hydrolase CwlJ-like protein